MISRPASAARWALASVCASTPWLASTTSSAPWQAASERRDLVGEVHVARGVDEVQDVVLAVLGLVVEAHRVLLDRDPALPLQVHGVQELLGHLPLGEGARPLQQAVGERGLAVVDVGDDREVADVRPWGPAARSRSNRAPAPTTTMSSWAGPKKKPVPSRVQAVGLVVAEEAVGQGLQQGARPLAQRLRVGAGHDQGHPAVEEGEEELVLPPALERVVQGRSLGHGLGHREEGGAPAPRGTGAGPRPRGPPARGSRTRSPWARPRRRSGPPPGRGWPRAAAPARRRADATIQTHLTRLALWHARRAPAPPEPVEWRWFAW